MTFKEYNITDISLNRASKGAKIIFVVKALDNITGGAERVLSDVASGLADRGHEVVILSFDRPGGTSFYPLSCNIRRIQLGIGDTFSRAKAGETLHRMTALRRAVIKENPFVVVAFMHSMFVPAAFALAGTGIRVLGSEHIVPDHYKNRKLEYALFIASSFFLSKVTVLSERIRDRYHGIIRRKMVVIPNPVNIPTQQVSKKNNEKIILNVGRLEEQKDQKTLIEAFGRIADLFPDWRVRIVGEGKQRQDLQNQIDRLGLQNKVVLAGTTRDIAEEYASATVFALPSLYESFGLATAEAMGYGLPAIGFSDCPGTNELITNNVNGILTLSDNRVLRYAEGLKNLMSDSVLRDRLGMEARKSAGKFSTESVVKEWEKFLGVA